MQELRILTNTLTGQHYNAAGQTFAAGYPQIFVNSHLLVYWQLYTATEGTVSSWQKSTAFSGCQAKFTGDNDWIHRASGILALEGITQIAAGTEFPATIQLDMPNTMDLAAEGEITLYNAAGEFESLVYTSRIVEDNIVTFHVGTGITAQIDHANGESVTVTQGVLFQAMADPELSDPETGLFAFRVNVTSTKLQMAADTASAGMIALKAIELLPYTVTNGAIVQYPAFQLESTILRTTMAEAGIPAQIGSALQDQISLMVEDQITAALEELTITVTANEVNITDAGGYFTSGTVEGALQEIGEELADIAGTVTSQGGTLTTLSGEVTSQGTQISTLSGTVTSQGGTLTTLSGEVTSQGQQISTLSGTVTSQGGTLTTLSGEVTSQGQTIEEINSQLDGVENLLSEV